MPRIDPTPGRVVYFWPTKRDCPGEWPGDGVPLAATIAHVHANGRIVNLTVHEASGVITSKRLVRLVQDDEKPIEGESFCSWMPYQIGQAKKHSDAPPDVVIALTQRVEELAAIVAKAVASAGGTTQPVQAGGQHGEGQGQGQQGQGQQG